MSNEIQPDSFSPLIGNFCFSSDLEILIRNVRSLSQIQLNVQRLSRWFFIKICYSRVSNGHFRLISMRRAFLKSIILSAKCVSAIDVKPNDVNGFCEITAKMMFARLIICRASWTMHYVRNGLSAINNFDDSEHGPRCTYVRVTTYYVSFVRFACFFIRYLWKLAYY